MGLREDVQEAKEEIQDLKEQSLAMELLHQSKKTNQRLFIIILVILTMWFVTIGYLVYVLNDIGTIETIDATQEVSDVDSINGSVVNNGDIYGESKANSKEN